MLAGVGPRAGARDGSCCMHAAQVAPADVSPGVVRTVVNAGLVLLVLGFAKSLLGVRTVVPGQAHAPQTMRVALGLPRRQLCQAGPRCMAGSAPGAAGGPTCEGPTVRAVQCSRRSTACLRCAQAPLCTSPACRTPQFFLTIGTVVFGAYVAVRVFGLDVTGSSDEPPARRKGGGSGKSERRACLPAVRILERCWRRQQLRRQRQRQQEWAAGAAGLLL